MNASTAFPNWFVQGGAEYNFERMLLPRAEHIQHCLQIGAFTGDASLWIMEHLPDATLVDVDTWTGSAEEEHATFDWDDVRSTYEAKVLQYRHRILTKCMQSDEFFAGNPAMFDFIYIDGAHDAKQVMRDALNATECIRVGGIIAFDDYQWGMHLPTTDRPRAAIEAFLSIYRERIEVLDIGLQAWVRWTE